MAVDALARAIAAGKVPVDAYEMAVAGGYTGTKEQFEEDMGNSGTNATNAANSATAAAASATTAANAAGNLAPAYSASATYAVGDHVLYNGGYYVCKTAITTAEEWTAAHWTAVKVGPEITDLKNAIDPYTKDFGILHGNVEYSQNLAIMFDSSKTVSSVDMSWTKDNVVRWNGTATANGGRTTHISEKLSLSAGTYTLSVTSLNAAAEALATRLIINVVDTSNTIIFSAEARNSNTYTFDSDTEVYLSFTLTNGTNYNGAEAGVMLNTGGTALPFESYYDGNLVDEKARDDIDSIETAINDKPFLPLKGKSIVIFGDSRTWYDGQTYGENTKSEWSGKTCVGYQETMKAMLDTDNITNEGVSGNNSVQICTRIRAYDFTGFDAVLLCGGVNDWVKSTKPPVGTLLPVGSAFDTTTVYGAWQSAIEYILTNYPSIKVFMEVPAIAWTNDGVYPYSEALIKSEIASFYNIPCKDMYKELGINLVNRDYYYCDDVNATGWRLHFNDYGNALYGTVIAQFMNTICGDIADTNRDSEQSNNLIQLNGTSTTVGTGVTVEATEKNEIKYNGTSSGTTGRTKKLSLVQKLPAGTYTLSCVYNNPETYALRTRISVYICDDSNNTLAQCVSTPITFTINTETAVYVSTTVASGVVCGNLSLSVMLNAGSTALPFEIPGTISAIDGVARSELIDKVSISSMKSILARNYSVDYANAVNPIDFKNIYNTNQNVHPKVLYFETLFGDHRYWMAYTPYTNENTAEENPCIAYSDDGIEWTNISENPLATGTTGEYYSDTHLVYNSTTGKLECWYRLASTTDNAEYIYRQVSSDGLTWDSQELMQTFTGGKSHALSPAIIWDATNQKYQIWLVNSSGGYHVEYYESSNGTTWTKIRDIDLTYVDGETTYYVWHIDVTLIDNVYYLIAMCKNDDENVPWPLFVSTSNNNTIYSTPTILMKPQSGAWDAYLYRTCIVKTVDDYRLYYSARKSNGVQGMGISIAKTLYKFIGYDLVES